MTNLILAYHRKKGKFICEKCHTAGLCAPSSIGALTRSNPPQNEPLMSLSPYFPQQTGPTESSGNNLVPFT
jgi:hypothetical protein